MRLPRWPKPEDDTDLFPRWTGKVKVGWFGRIYAEASVPVPDPGPFWCGVTLSRVVWVRINKPVLKQILDENGILRRIADQYEAELHRNNKKAL